MDQLCEEYNAPIDQGFSNNLLSNFGLPQESSNDLSFSFRTLGKNGKEIQFDEEKLRRAEAIFLETSNELEQKQKIHKNREKTILKNPISTPVFQFTTAGNKPVVVSEESMDKAKSFFKEKKSQNEKQSVFQNRSNLPHAKSLLSSKTSVESCISANAFSRIDNKLKQLKKPSRKFELKVDEKVKERHQRIRLQNSSNVKQPIKKTTTEKRSENLLDRYISGTQDFVASIKKKYSKMDTLYSTNSCWRGNTTFTGFVFFTRFDEVFYFCKIGEIIKEVVNQPRIFIEHVKDFLINYGKLRAVENSWIKHHTLMISRKLKPADDKTNLEFLLQQLLKRAIIENNFEMRSAIKLLTSMESTKRVSLPYIILRVDSILEFDSQFLVMLTDGWYCLGIEIRKHQSTSFKEKTHEMIEASPNDIMLNLIVTGKMFPGVKLCFAGEYTIHSKINNHHSELIDPLKLSYNLNSMYKVSDVNARLGFSIQKPAPIKLRALKLNGGLISCLQVTVVHKFAALIEPNGPFLCESTSMDHYNSRLRFQLLVNDEFDVLVQDRYRRRYVIEFINVPNQMYNKIRSGSRIVLNRANISRMMKRNVLDHLELEQYDYCYELYFTFADQEADNIEIMEVQADIHSKLMNMHQQVSHFRSRQIELLCLDKLSSVSILGCLLKVLSNGSAIFFLDSNNYALISLSTKQNENETPLFPWLHMKSSLIKKPAMLYNMCYISSMPLDSSSITFHRLSFEILQSSIQTEEFYKASKNTIIDIAEFGELVEDLDRSFLKNTEIKKRIAEFDIEDY